jgi:hypothetical protein
MTFKEITDALAAEQEEEALVPGHLHKWFYGRIHGKEHGNGRREIYATMFAQMEPLDSKTVSDAEFVHMFSGHELTRAARASAKGKAGAVQLSASTSKWLLLAQRLAGSPRWRRLCARLQLEHSAMTSAKVSFLRPRRPRRPRRRSRARRARRACCGCATRHGARAT